MLAILNLFQAIGCALLRFANIQTGWWYVYYCFIRDALYVIGFSVITLCTKLGAQCIVIGPVCVRVCNGREGCVCLCVCVCALTSTSLWGNSCVQDGVMGCAYLVG